jgi:hypothetical protein
MAKAISPDHAHPHQRTVFLATQGMFPSPTGALSSRFKFRTTGNGSHVLCLDKEEWSAPEVAAAAPASSPTADAGKGRALERLTKASGPRHAATGEAVKIGGAFSKTKNPSFLRDRAEVYDRVIAGQAARLAGLFPLVSWHFSSVPCHSLD